MRSKPTFSNKLAALLVLMVMLACNVPSSWTDSLVPGGTWYVDKTGADSNDCLSATSACLTITAAVSKALTAGVIQIGSGTFEEITSGVPQSGLYINNKVLTFRGTVTGGALETIISGGHARTAVEVRGSAIIIFQDLIIQDGGGRLDAGAGYGLKINGSVGSTAGVELSNVIIRNNEQTGLSIRGRGPVTLDNVQVLANGFGLFSSTIGPVTIKNSTFSGNTNGAIGNNDGDRMVITDTTISDNGSGNNGGAINSNGEMRIEGSTISGTLLSSDGYDGTGVNNRGTLLTMIDSTVTGNSGMGIGSYGELDLNDVEVSLNDGDGVKFFDHVIGTFHRVTLMDNGGYGLYSNQGFITMDDSHIVGNHVGFFNSEWAAISDTEITGNYGSGVVNSVGGTMTIVRSTISGTLPDSAGRSSRGIYNMGTSMTVTNSTISGNTAVGISTGTSMRLIFTTVAENGRFGISAGSGSSGTAPTFHLENSIIVNNADQDCSIAYDPPRPVFALRGTNISDGSCETRYEATAIRILNDAFLDHLANNDGLTQTNALLPGSLAIDAATVTCPATDQRGIARPQGAGCDIGAYEYEGGSAIAPLEFVTPTEGTPVVVPLFTDTPTPAGPVILTFAKNAYCRKGPSSLYKDVSGFIKGDTAQADGRNEVDPRWWWVQIPNSTEHCWVSHITVDPNDLADNLPIQPIDALELPAAPASFVISNRICSQNGYVLKLAWTNSAGADGYTLYLNGQEIATFKSSQSVYQENPPLDKSLHYELEAFNENGFSERLVIEDRCP